MFLYQFIVMTVKNEKLSFQGEEGLEKMPKN